MISLAGWVAGPMATVWAYLPPGDSDPASGHGPEWGKAAPIGLLIWLLMGIALYLLIKSMNRNLRRVPKSFDGDGAPEGTGDEAGGDGSAEVSADEAVGDGSAEAPGDESGDGRAGGDGAAGQPTAGGARRGS